MTTFTQIIDDLVLETVRPDLRTTLADYLNQTIREMHNKSGPSNETVPVYYPDNRMEDLISLSGITDSNKVYNWTIPNITRFQQIEAVFYKGLGRYALPRTPRNALRFNPAEISAMFYYYRSGPVFCLMNPGVDGQQVALAWFEYPANLALYDAAKAPILYDKVNDVYTLNPSRADQTLTLEQAMEKSTNWLIQRHTATIKEGVRAKIYKRISDGSDRARLAFSQFEILKTAVQNTESIEFVINSGN